MTAILETVAKIARPAEAASEIARLNDRLARDRTIPPDVQEAVGEIVRGVNETELARWEQIDPSLAFIVHRAVLQAEQATHSPESESARDELRIALETLRQGFSAIAEGEPVGDDRSGKEVVRWLLETTGVPQQRLADLLGVRLRTLQRWASPSERPEPGGLDDRRLRAVARIVNQLRFSLTPVGAIEWFEWPRSDLRGKTPADVLGDPNRLPELVLIAGSMRSTYLG